MARWPRPRGSPPAPRDRDGRDVRRPARAPQALSETVQAVLGAPGDLQDVIGLSRLAVGERDAIRGARE